MTTREKIIYESLKLFSTNGYEAVSTRMIAKAAGISDTGIYKHFKSKQEILDTIVIICQERFKNRRMEVDIHNMCWEDVEQVCMDMFQFQISDEWIVMFRGLLVVEQFKNPYMAQLYQSFFIDIAVDGMTLMFDELMKLGYMKEYNPRVLSLELYAPFFLYHTLQPDSEEVLNVLREHVTYFRENYKTLKCEEVSHGLRTD